MTTATHPPRTREPICPPWCEGHDGTSYQGWESTGPGGMQLRDHADEGVFVSNVNVMLVQREHGDHTLDRSVIAVYVDDGDDVLSPDQARELAAVLLAAAERVEARG